jgi:hypothetical protein
MECDVVILYFSNCRGNSPARDKRRSAGSDEVVEITGAMNDAMYLDNPSTDDVENEVGLNNQDTITVLSEFRVARDPSKERMTHKPSNAVIKPIDEGKCPAWTLLCDELENGREIVFSCRKVAECDFTGH